MDRRKLAEGILAAARKAAGRILEIYNGDFAVRSKSDESPVTDADEAGEKIILAELAVIAPDIPVIAEESVAAGRIPEIGDGPFFLVDPLDGTKEFINRNGEFTVNIALIENGMPILGAVVLPALDTAYWVDGEGVAWRQKGAAAAEIISTRTPAPDGLVVVASKSHRDSKTDEYLARLPVKEVISAGSSAKLCRVAEGSADLYPRLGRTMEWDIAAGHAVLRAAGGRIERLDNGEPLTYGKTGLDNPHFAAWGR